MVPQCTRRQTLGVTGSLVGVAGLGRSVTGERQATTDDGPDEAGWRMERHDPAGTGYAPDASGPKDGVGVRWKRPVDSALGFWYRATPIVADGLVYGVGRELVCVDAASGDEVFRVDRGFTNPPAVAAARAYRSPTLVFGARRGVEGVSARGGRTVAGVRTGLTRWTVDGGNGNGLASSLLGGPSHSVPVAAGGTAFVTAGDHLHAIDASNGRVRWRRPGGGYRPVVRDGTVYVAAFELGVVGYDVESGDRVFAPDLEQFPLSLTASPERLVVLTDRGLLGVDYDGTLAWRNGPEAFWDQGAVAVADGVAYTAGVNADDHLVAVDVADGRTLWESAVAPEQEPQFAPPAVADGVVYVPDEDDGIAAIDATDGRLRWRFAPGDGVTPWSPAALVGETLYVRGNEHLYALEEA